MEAVGDRLAAAKLWLISRGTQSEPDAPRNLSYLTHALYALVAVPTSAVATIAADEYWRLYVNPGWAFATEVPEIARELVHLTWHLLMDHAGRARGMLVDATTSDAWHRACELTVDETLAPSGASPSPTAEEAALTGATPAGRFGRLRSGRSAEEYFAALSGLPVRAGTGTGEEGAGCRCGSCCDGIPRSSDLPPDADAGLVDRVGAEFIRERVAIDYQEYAKARGDEPGEALRWARGITEPRIPWEPLLARTVRHAVGSTSGRQEPTWTRPSRRQSSVPQVLLPGWRRPLPTVAMVVDTSASVDDFLLGRALAEVDGALRGLGVAGAQVMVYACDAALGAVTRVRRASDAALVGGGGTDLRIGIAAASAHRPRPDLIVVFTDGYTPWPATPPPGSAVIAAMLRRADETLPPAPVWATRIDCVLDT